MPIRSKDEETRRQEAEMLEELKLSKTFTLLQQIQSRCKLYFMQNVLDLTAKKVAGSDNLNTLVVEIFKESAKAQESDYLTSIYIPNEIRWLNQQRTKADLSSK